MRMDKPLIQRTLILLAVVLLITGCFRVGGVAAPRPEPEKSEKPSDARVGHLPPGFAGTDDCPRDQVTAVWDLGRGRWLLEQQAGRDTFYRVWDSSTSVLDIAIGAADTASFDRLEGGNVVFLARGGGDCGAYSFPYEIVYDPDSGKRTERPLYLPVKREVVFGKAHAWPQVMVRLSIEEDGVSFDFQPRAGAVLAGGHWLPETVSSYDEREKELVLTFRDVKAGRALVTGRVLRSSRASLVDHVLIRPAGSDLQVRIGVRPTVLWNAGIKLLGGEGYSSTVRCRVLFVKAAP